MENNKGYVYVMINPSYEGLVKIGKTTKDPEERAKELSSATGIATPFIVAYKRMFNDCSRAESLIHSILEERGHRINKSREFFSISISDAINVLLEIKEPEIDSAISISQQENVHEKTDSLAEYYCRQALKYHYGYENTFRDTDKAVDLYNRSIELGSIDACLYLGYLYKNLSLRSSTKNLSAKCTSNAIKAFQKGAEKDDWKCLAELAIVSNDWHNSWLAWKRFFDIVIQQYPKLDYNEEALTVQICSYIFEYIPHYSLGNNNVDKRIEKYIGNNIDVMYEQALKFIEDKSKTDSIYTNNFLLPYLRGLREEARLRSIKNGNNICQDFFTAAEKFYYGNEYCKNLSKALMLYKRSKELGSNIADIYIGEIEYLNNNQEGTKTAWNNFYNFTYDTAIANNSLSEVSIETLELLIGGYMEIFEFAVKNECTSILNPYYAYLAMRIGIVDYYTLLMDDLHDRQKVLEIKMKNRIEDKEERIRLTKESYNIQADLLRIRDIHNYIKTIVAQMQATGNTRVEIVRLN